ncbi:MAG: mtrR 2 [Bacilli bacterium]|nr:mtrR 2 [Bacilli bacterium]
MSQRSSEQNEDIRDERKKQILDAALSVYVQKGYAGAEVSDVAEQAGLKRGLVYYYFNTKEELFQSLFSWMIEKSREFAKQNLLDAEGSPSERLLNYAQQLCRGALRDSRFPRFHMRAYEEAREVYEGKEEEYIRNRYILRDHIAVVVKQGMNDGELRQGDPILAANAYWGALIPNLTEYLGRKISADTVEATALVEEIVSYCLFGLLSIR